MNEIIIATPKLEYKLDENDELMKFPSREHAVGFLKSQGMTNNEIDSMSFIYTNESRECNCFLCEKRHGCYIRDKFQRLPRGEDGLGGLGLCPKLE